MVTFISGIYCDVSFDVSVYNMTMPSLSFTHNFSHSVYFAVTKHRTIDYVGGNCRKLHEYIITVMISVIQRNEEDNSMIII